MLLFLVLLLVLAGVVACACPPPPQSPARLAQLSSGSPSPKVVQWGSLVSSSSLRKLPDTAATDASQSIFVPTGSGAHGKGLVWGGEGA